MKKCVQGEFPPDNRELGAIERRWLFLKAKNNENNSLLQKLFYRFIENLHGARFLSSTVFSINSQAALDVNTLIAHFDSLNEPDISATVLPEYESQKRINSWYPEEKSVLYGAVIIYFLKQGSLSPSRKRKRDIRPTWEQVLDIFNEEKKRFYQLVQFTATRSSSAINRQFKDIRNTQQCNLKIYYMYWLKLDQEIKRM